jgi:type 2 lantibiotic biosynthesis protein LanM
MRKEVFVHQDLLERIAARASMPPERSLLRNEAAYEVCESEVQARVEHLYDLVGATDDEQMARFLIQHQLDSEQLGRFLSSPLRLPDPPPSWIAVLEQVVREEVPGASQRNVMAAQDPSLLAKDPLPFQEVFLPFLHYARQQYAQRTANAPSLFENEVQITLERWLLSELCGLAGETLLLEFSRFRQRQACGERSSESRRLYEAFVAQYQGEGRLPFFLEYSVLARLAVLKVEQWVDVCTEFVQRLAADLDELEKTFYEGKSVGPVVKVQPSYSDPHHQGRSVFLLTFAEGVEVVYKPRSLAVDQAFAHLLLWSNAHGLTPSLKPVRVLSRPTHGWTEYVAHEPCSSRQEVHTYYRRAGILLCWLYVLGGTDIHNENLIACGAHPMLIDLETIIYPGFPPCLEYQEPWENTIRSDELLCQSHSVLRSRLLPEWLWSEMNSLIYDNSGLGGVKEHLQEQPRRFWQHINTDAMERESVPYPGDMHQNAVLLQDAVVDPLAYGEEVLQGFCTAYRFLLAHRHELLAPDGALSAFEDCPLRFVRRATQTYATALEILEHPLFLREGTDRWIELQVFATSLLQGQTHPALWKVAESEMLALSRLDIPRFGARASSHDLWLETGEILPEVFPCSALEQARACLARLDEADLARQRHLIRTAYLLAQPLQEMSEQDGVPPLYEQEKHEALSADALTGVARHLGQHLRTHAYGNLAMRQEGSWVGLLYQDTLSGFRQGSVGFDVYQGACGIALFLAALDKVTGEQTFRDLILSALDPLCRKLKQATTSLVNSASASWNIGGTSGLGSWMYALSRIGIWLEVPELLEAAWQSACLLTEQRVQADHSFDVVAGSAGALLGVLSLYQYQQKDDLLQRALWCGQHLLKNRVATASGSRAWPAFQLHPLTGFSHGAAGIAYALLRLAEVTGSQVWKEAAEEALAFEQSHFLPEEQNWRDLRKQPEETDAHTPGSALSAWCHGAAGIGLARLGGLTVLDTAQTRADLTVALETTQTAGLQEVDSLCCGNSGRIELLVAASQRLKQPQHLEVARHWSSVLVRRAEQRGGFRLLSRLPRQAYHPGLFQGTAGIGYQLLRAACPDQLPSVLLWE